MSKLKTKAQIEKRKYEIMGLLSLAKTYNKMLHAIETSLMEITGEEEYGHCGDLVWGEIEKLSPEKGYAYLMERLTYARDREKKSKK